MVCSGNRHGRVLVSLSVLALSSRFDGPESVEGGGFVPVLSVLALSSRFDGPVFRPGGRKATGLSVLALSSRFDGHAAFLD